MVAVGAAGGNEPAGILLAWCDSVKQPLALCCVYIHRNYSTQGILQLYVGKSTWLAVPPSWLHLLTP